MFLNAITLKNIQARLNEKCIFMDEVEIRAVHWSRDIVLVRYVFNGDDVVSYIDLPEGDFVADALSEAIRCQDFYRFSDLAAGFEKDDSAEAILKVWPIAVEVSNVFLIKPAEIEYDDDDDEQELGQNEFLKNSPVDLSQLSNKFNIVRRKSK